MEGPVVLCFGVVRPYKGVDVLLEAFRDVDGAELWVVGRPLGESMERLRRLAPPGRVRFVPRYVSDSRAARVLPPRRPARAAAQARGRVRSAVRRPRLREGDGALRRGRLPRSGGGARRRAAGPARGPRGARRRRSASCSPTRRRARSWRSAPAAAAAGPYSWDRIGRAHARPLRGARAREGRVHGQEQALGGARARLARGARLRGGRRGGLGAGRVDARRAARGPRGARLTGCRSWPRTSSTRRAERGTLGEVDLVVSFLFWKRIREPLISLGRVGCLNFHPAPLPDFRGLGGYNVALLEGVRSGACRATSWTSDIDTGDLVEVERFPIDPRRGDGAVARRAQPGAAARAVPARDRARRCAGEELPREPQGRGAT